METFSASLALCAGNSPVTGEFPPQRPGTRSFDVPFDLRLNQKMSKQWRRRWFETPSRSLWRHCNVTGAVLMGKDNCTCVCTYYSALPISCGLYYAIYSHKIIDPSSLTHVSGVLCQKHVSRAGTNNYIPQIQWYVITCPCPWYRLLAQHFSVSGIWVIIFLAMLIYRRHRLSLYRGPLVRDITYSVPTAKQDVSRSLIWENTSHIIWSVYCDRCTVLRLGRTILWHGIYFENLHEYLSI